MFIPLFSWREKIWRTKMKEIIGRHFLGMNSSLESDSHEVSITYHP